MNWLLIIVLLFLAASVVAGYSKGFLRVIYSLVEWILVLVFVTWATPYVSHALVQYTSIDTKIEQNIEARLQDYVQNLDNNEIPENSASPDNSTSPENSENASAENSTDASTGIQESASQQALAALGLKLPAVIANTLLDTNDLADHVLEETGMYKSVATKLTGLAMNGLAFVIVLIVSMVICFLIGRALKLVDKIPILNGINKTLGIMAGLLKGIIIVWIVFTIIAFASGTSIGGSLLTYIYEAQFLRWLYDNNLVLSIITIFL